MKDLNGKVAVITGAGSGLGRELALCCTRRGMKLVLADVDEPGMEETLRLARDERADVEALLQKVDVSKLEQLEALAAATKERFGAAHLLFNNAGVSTTGAPIWEHTAADWQWVLGVNVYGIVWGLKAFMPMLLEQNEGHVINTASAAGWMATPNMGVYCTSKCSAVMISEVLAADLRAKGSNIGVTVLSPAFFPTRISEAARNRPKELADTIPMTEEVKQRMEAAKQVVQAGRISAAEIAEQTLQAVEANKFYVFPHGRVKKYIEDRAAIAVQEAEGYDWAKHSLPALKAEKS